MNSLGLDKPANATKVSVAMSGGVDSSATAALLVDQGYQVEGVTLKLYDMAVAVTTGTCCAGTDIKDAAEVCKALSIPHRVLDLEEEFRRDVILPFADSYLAGETPIPCVACNQTVKFRDLLALVDDSGADLLVTGHYARIEPDGPSLWRGVDASRDQSYFLFATTKAQLARLRFPLGAMSKDETRRLAARFDLPVAQKPDSQDICFVPKGDYKQVLRRLRKGRTEEGEIVDLNDRVVGAHCGVSDFTIGQRRGLQIGGQPEPLYVVRLDVERNKVVVGPKEALLRRELRLRDVNWIGEGDHMPEEFSATVKLRSSQSPLKATITAESETDARVQLETPHHGVAPGQACVFHQGERVLGGGWITRD